MKDKIENHIHIVNARFNEELQQQINGTLPKGHTYKLGRAGQVLQSAGIPDLPIELQASRLSDKSMQENHPFDLVEVKDLPNSIQNPLAIFRSATRIGSFVIMTKIKYQGRNFVAAIRANKRNNKIEVNEIRSIYPKNNRQIANWINEKLLKYVDKEKTLNWLSGNATDVRSAGLSIKSITKLVMDF